MMRDDWLWSSDSIASHTELYDVIRIIDSSLVEIDDMTHEGGGYAAAAAAAAAADFDGCSSVCSNSNNIKHSNGT